MLSQAEYIRNSLELNLVFDRIMKEHMIFVAASLTPKNMDIARKAEMLKEQFTSLLAQAVSLANGVISPGAKASGEIVTPFTLMAEKATQNFTGIPINMQITQAEASLMPAAGPVADTALMQKVHMLNQNAITLTKQIIQAKEQLLHGVTECKIFTHLYPTLIKHVLEEAQMYHRMLMELQAGKECCTPREAAEHEAFWNHILEEHALFIRGMLDPSEEALIKKADGFAEQFKALTRSAREAVTQLMLLPQVTRNSFNATREIRNFKAQGTKGSLECEVKSVILPLLSDHVLREASYYLRVLTGFQRS